LFDEIKALGFVGTHKTLDKFLSPWRLGNVAFEASARLSTSTTQSKSVLSVPSPTPLPDPTQHRQISPQIAAALLAKPRLELTGRQADIVDALKTGCPGYAAMRSLMLGFRSLMRQPKGGSSQAIGKARRVSLLHRWIERADATGIVLIQNFAGRLRRDILAVEAAVTEKWSNGVVEGQVNRLKTF
jgi:hypothetical protein